MTFRKLDLFPSSGEGGEEDAYSALSKGPGWVGFLFPTYIWGRKQIQFPKRRVFWNTGRWKKSKIYYIINISSAFLDFFNECGRTGSKILIDDSKGMWIRPQKITVTTEFYPTEGYSKLNPNDCGRNFDLHVLC
jgi:hypothetical protein